MLQNKCLNWKNFRHLRVFLCHESKFHSRSQNLLLSGKVKKFAKYGSASDSVFPNHGLAICGAQSSLTSIRCKSTEVAEAATEKLSNVYIPEPPVVPDATVTETVLNSLGEPTLGSLGLCNYTPVGLVQYGLEMLHVGADLPWWGAIVTGTVILRLCCWPVTVYSKKQAVKLQNHLPTLQKLQEKFSRARASKNNVQATKAYQELKAYQDRNNVKMSNSFKGILVQAPIFISTFLALRSMANLPVESMQTGGMSWITDLTVPDPYYVLPILSMATLLLTIEKGVDGPTAASMSHGQKWFMRAMPITMVFFVVKFPAAVVVYWATSNILGLCLTSILKFDIIKKKLDLPEPVKHDRSFDAKKKGFVEGFRESMDNMKVMAELEKREEIQAERFRKAGIAPLQKTYKTPPQKISSAN